MSRYLLGLLVICLPFQAQALLTIDVQGDIANSLPIVVVPFGSEGIVAPVNISEIIRNDLEQSGRFSPLLKQELISEPHVKMDIDFSAWQSILADGLLIGKVNSTDGQTFQVQFQLFDIYKSEQLVGKRYQVPVSGLRRLAHQIADQVYQELTGEAGVFSTRLAFVSVVNNAGGVKLFSLQISDSDGANPRVILQSKQPIFSPKWSPDGERLAYVSFENEKAEVFVQKISNGRRKSVADFNGLGNTVAWSPDGKKLALTLSKTGNAEIYTFELATSNLIRITHNSQAIDIEAVWMRNGQDLVFTSDRGGRAQIYKVSVDGGREQRLTFEGRSNTSPTISPDGRLMAMVHESNGKYHVAVQNLDSGEVQVLGECDRKQSLSFAPNSKMLVYSMEKENEGSMIVVSVNGSNKKYLDEAGSSSIYPTWSPFRE